MITRPPLSGFLGGAFSPERIAGLKLGLLASRLSGLSAGDPVSALADTSGQGNNATQATSGKRPLLALVSGKQYLRFDGADDEMTVGTSGFPSGASARTLFVVFRRGASTTVDVVFGYGASGVGSGYGLYYNASGVVSFWGQGADYSTGVTVAQNTAALMTFSYSGTVNTVRKNGAQVDSRAISLGSVLTSCKVGVNHSFASNFLKGDFGAALLYDSELSAGQVAAVESYLNAEFAVY